MTPGTLVWFRRDLRIGDHPALSAAVARAERDRGRVVPVFVVDPVFWRRAGAPRLRFLAGCLGALDRDLGGRLVVRTGDPLDVVPALAAETGARSVCVTGDHAPYGRRRDDRVRAALGAMGVAFVTTGSPYAVEPGHVRTGAGTPYHVFTPFARAWNASGFEVPVPVPPLGRLSPRGAVASDPVPTAPATPAALPPAGERPALQRLDAFVADGLTGYARGRDLPATDHTSRLSPYLRFGCIHPRTVLAALPATPDADQVRAELAWREFYADGLRHRPASAWEPVQARAGRLRVDTGPIADERFAAWCAGETGFALVDAGMRQLAAEAWMHNRVRMVTASFLVKDLHLPWQRGARYFLQQLVDGDLASNNLGWQWVAGSGADAAPFHRIFNPATQAERFDPDRVYQRRWLPDGPRPDPIVDHVTERAEALRRHAETR